MNEMTMYILINTKYLYTIIFTRRGQMLRYLYYLLLSKDIWQCISKTAQIIHSNFI